ncbi:Ig-like domain-containing protein, partial [Lacihabitans soyangensis]
MKQIYLLIASIGFVLTMFGISNLDINRVDSTAYLKSKPANAAKQTNPPRKYRSMVLKPQVGETNYLSRTQNWVEETFFLPTITATKSVTVQGGGNALPGGILNYSIILSNTASGSANDATGVLFTDQLISDLTLVAGSVKATPIAGDDAYSSIGNVGINVPAGSGLLANDNSPTNEPITVTAVNTAGTSGTVTFNPNGSFTFTPNAGFSGTTTFSYTATGSSSSLTGTGTVTITVTSPIWFVDIAATTSTNIGTLANPFKNWSDFAASNALSGATNPAANQTIFVYSGTYTGAATLKSGQKVLGAGATVSLASFAGVTVPAHSSPALPSTNLSQPNLTISSGTTITLGSNNTLRGFDMGNSTKDIVGNNFGTLTASEMDLIGTGAALDLTNGILACSFQEISASSSTATALKATSVTGSLSNTTGTISATNNVGVNITGTNSSNKVGLALTFVSVSASGAANGLNIQNTTGALNITGSGTTAGSGGTIQNTTENGVFLNNVSSVSLNYMNITNTSKSCFYANNLSGTCAINNSALSLGANALNVPTTPATTSYDRRCVHILNENVAMTLNVNNSTFTGQLTTSPNDNHGLAYETTTAANSSTVGTLNIKNSAFYRFNNYAVYTTSTGSAITDVGIQGSSVNYDGGTTYVGGAFHLYNLRSAKTTFNVLNNTSILTKGGLPIEFYSNNFDGSDFTPASGRGMEGKFNGNILTRHSTDAGTAVNILVRGKSNGVVQVNSNTITKGNLTLQAAENTPEAAAETARLDATITNNIIEELLSNYGIDVLSGNGSSGATWSNVINCVKISGNTINPIDVNGLGLLRFRTEGVSGGNASRIWREGINGVGETNSTTYWNGNSNTPNSPGSSPFSTRVRDSGFGVLEFRAGGTCLTPNNAAPSALIAEPGKATMASLESSKISDDLARSESNLRIDKQSSNEEATLVEKKVNVNDSDNTQKSLTGIEAGETVTVNGAGSGFLLPAGKSTTITFSATISNSPSTCAITNTASVSGSNFSTVNSNTTTSNIVIPPPTAVTTATSICTGQSISLSATCSIGTVQWYTVAAPSTLLGTSASGATFSQSPITNTTYQAACKVNGCESARTNSGLITVNPLPTISVSASPAICEGVSSFIIPYTATTGSPTTYSISGTGITTVTNASLPATPITVNLSSAATGSSYSYTLTVRNANGCVSSNVTGSVVVNPIPTITTSASPAICTGATQFTIPYTATTGSPTTYSISGTGITTVTNGALPSSSPITVSLSGPASGSSISYTLTVRNAGGCTSSNVIGNVTVNPLPTLTTSASPAICSGATSFTIPYTTTSGTPTTFSISGAGITPVIDATMPSLSPITVGLSSGASGPSISYVLTVKNANGCTSSNINGSVTVNTTPATPSISSNSPLCVGNNLSLSSPLVSGATYSWTGPNGFSSSLQNPGINNVTTAAGGTYSLNIVVTGCTSSTSQTVVTVNSTPAPTSPVALPSTISVSGNTTTLTASGCNSPNTISWYDSANPLVALPNNTPTISSNKTFFARCTGTNTCVSEPSTNVNVSYNPCTPLGSSPGNVNITWTGLLSTDWNTACNWNPAWVPDLTTGKVIIPNTANKPVVSSSVPDIKSIEIQSTALLTINSGRTLNIRGDGGLSKGFTIAGGTLTNNGTINIESATNTAIPAYIYLQATDAVLTNNGTIKINSTDEAIGVGSVSTPATITNSLNGIINIVGGIGVEMALPTDVVNFSNAGTINYDGTVLAFKFLGTTNFTNTGTVNINSGTGIENPTGNTINNNACGKILMASGTYTNGGTTTNTGLIQMPNTYSFTNTGTFTNNGVLKANAVSGITNNKVVITNSCPIFTLGGSNNYSVSGIFTDAGATTSAGSYTSVGNMFTANNTIPTGTQTLYAQVTDGTCTFVVPFDFDNKKPTSVSVNNTTVCSGTSVTLSGTCPSGTTLTWYTTATGGSNIGTGTNLSNSPTVSTTYYAACESTNCVSGRVATNAITIVSTPVVSLFSKTDVSCNGGNNGTATVTASSGTAPYTYSWAPSGGTAATATGLAAGTYTGTAATATGLSAGTYTVTVTDANSCQKTATVNITQPTAWSHLFLHKRIFCNGASTGSATVSASGGNPNYTYSWAPSGGTAAIASGL